MGPSEMLRLADLAARAGTRASTIRYYVKLGVLSKAHGTTSGAFYGCAHVVELAAIKRFKRRGLTLAEIRTAMTVDRVCFSVRQRLERSDGCAEHVVVIGSAVEIRYRSSLGTVEKALAKRVVASACLAAEIYADELSSRRCRTPRSRS